MQGITGPRGSGDTNGLRTVKLPKALVLIGQWIMRVFGKEENGTANEIDGLLSLLERNPADTVGQTRPAEPYSPAADQEFAGREYQAAANHLSADGFDLEAIAIYKRLLNSSGVSLTREASASLEEAEDLLMRAKRAYEAALQTNPQNDEVDESTGAYQQTTSERRADPERLEIPEKEEAEPIPIEMLLDRSQDSKAPNERVEEYSVQPETLSSDGLALVSPKSGDGDFHIDINSVQIDDDLEAILFGDEAEPISDDRPTPYAFRPQSDEDIIYGLQKKLSDIRAQAKSSPSRSPGRPSSSV